MEEESKRSEYLVGNSNKQIKIEINTETEGLVSIHASINHLNGSRPQTIKTVKANIHGDVTPAKNIGKAVDVNGTAILIKMDLLFNTDKFDEPTLERALKTASLDIILKGGSPDECTYPHNRKDIVGGNKIILAGIEYALYNYNKMIYLT